MLLALSLSLSQRRPLSTRSRRATRLPESAPAAGRFALSIEAVGGAIHRRGSEAPNRGMWGEICASANPRSCGARPWFLSGGVVRGPWGFTAGDSLIPFLAFPFSGHSMNSARRSARSPLRSPVLGFSRSSEGPSCRGSSWLASGRTDHPTALSRFIVPASDSFPGGRRRSRDELPHMTIISDFHAPVGDDGALLSEKHIGRSVIVFLRHPQHFPVNLASCIFSGVSSDLLH